MLEFRRFIARHRLDKFRLNPHFPVNSLMLMRGLIAAREAGSEAAYLEMGLKGLWEEGLKLDDPDVLKRRIDAAGLDSASLLAAAQSQPVKQKLADNTAAAVARGVFGVPTFFVGDEMFFGKERLGQVEEAVEAMTRRLREGERGCAILRATQLFQLLRRLFLQLEKGVLAADRRSEERPSFDGLCALRRQGSDRS